MAHCNNITDASVNVKIEAGKKCTVDLAIFLQKKFKALRIIGSNDSLIKIGCVPSCASLTTLSIEKFTVKQNVLNALSDAVCHQYLPCVQDISFIECKGLKNKLKLLFQTQWKSLKSLNLYGCLIRVDDLKVIVRMVTLQAGPGEATVPLLPNLTSLTLSIAELCPNQRTDGVEEIFESNIWKQLTVLKLDTKVSESNDYKGDDYLMFEHALNKGKLCNLATIGINRALKDNPVELKRIPLESLSEAVMLHACLANFTKFIQLSERLANLNPRTIDISHGTGMRNQLSTLLHYLFTSLSTLVLSNCGLTNVDLQSLADASLECRLPALRHLNLSENCVDLKHLFHQGCKWNKLLTLDVKGIKMPRLFGKGRSDCFTSLEEITFSYYKYWCEEICWCSLQMLCIYDCQTSDKKYTIDKKKTRDLEKTSHKKNTSDKVKTSHEIKTCDKILFKISQMKDRGSFKKLNTVCINDNSTEIVSTDAVCKLAKHNVGCHLGSPITQPFTRARCACQRKYPLFEVTSIEDVPEGTGRRVRLWGNWRKWRSQLWKVFKKCFALLAVVLLIYMLYREYSVARNLKQLPLGSPWYSDRRP